MKKTLNSLHEIIPKQWNNQDVIVSAYRVVNIPNNLIINDFELLLPNLYINWIFGEINLDEIEERIDFKGNNNNLLELSVGLKTVSKKGVWILFFQPYEQQREAELKNLSSSYCGVYLALNGLANAYSLEFQKILSCENKMSSVGAGYLNPTFLNDVDITEKKLSLIKNLFTIISNFNDSKKNRLLLALHWFEKSVRNTGVDSYLNAWIALEALAMPNSSNVTIVKEKLSKIYNVPKNVIEEKFCLGLLCRLRGKIVHDGAIISINPQLLDQLHLIFTDLLLVECDVEPIYKCKSIMSYKINPIRPILNSILK